MLGAAFIPSIGLVMQPVPHAAAFRSYATPEQYIARYGLDEAVQLLTDEEHLLTKQLLMDHVSGYWTGNPTGPEKEAAAAALTRLKRQIAVSANFMDGYLRSAVTLPLSPERSVASVPLARSTVACVRTGGRCSSLPRRS